MTPEQQRIHYIGIILVAMGTVFILYPALNTKKISNAVFAFIGILCLVSVILLPR